MRTRGVCPANQAFLQSMWYNTNVYDVKEWVMFLPRATYVCTYRFVPNKVTKHGINTWRAQLWLQMPPPKPPQVRRFQILRGGLWGLLGVARQRLEFPILYPSSTYVHMVSRTRQKTKTGGFGCVKLLSHISSYHTVFCPFEAALLDFASSTPRSGWMIPGNEDPKSMIHGTGRKKK